VDLAVVQIEKRSARGRSCGWVKRRHPADRRHSDWRESASTFALGVGGVPRGRIVENLRAGVIGKTTLALQVIAEAQKLGGMRRFVRTRSTRSMRRTHRNWASDIDNLLVSSPTMASRRSKIVEVLIRSNGVD